MLIHAVNLAEIHCLSFHLQIIMSQRGQHFATIKIFYSNTEEYMLVNEVETGKSPLLEMAINHAVSQYCYQVHFKVKEKPSDNEKSNYEWIFKIIEYAFEIFCLPK